MSLYFTEDHEWVRVDGDKARIGVSTYAQEQLGDVVFVELPHIGQALDVGKDAAVVESVKAASEVFAPISGTVTAINDALEADPSLVNSSPEADGWFFTMTIADKDELSALMDEAAYKAFCADL